MPNAERLVCSFQLKSKCWAHCELILLEILVQTVLLWWVTVLITHLWWEADSLWISSVLTAFCCSESLSALLQVKVYTQVCFCISCHILISSFLQQAHISSKFAKPDWLQTWVFCCNWRSFTCFSATMFEFHSTAWGKPWNLLCSNKTTPGYNYIGIQRPNQQIRKEILPPLTQVNDIFGLISVRLITYSRSHLL